MRKEFLLFFLLCGCQTTSGPVAEKKQMNISVESAIKAFDRATLGVRGKSLNGREIVSKFQNPTGDSYEPAGNKRVRAYSRLLILGDRRPYDLQVQFIIEERNDEGEYDIQGYDEDRAHAVLKKMLDLLVNRPGRKDFIDDFRSL